MLLSSVLPDTQLITRTVFETRDIPALLKEGYALSVGIEDPMTEKPGVRLAMDCAYGPFVFGRTGNKKLEEVEKCQKK